MKIRKDESGLTLVELIVSFAILVIVFGSILSFLITGTSLFKSSNTETNIQNEAQLTNNRIHDMLENASADVEYYVGSSNVFSDNEVTDSENAEQKSLCIYNWTDDGSGGKKMIVYTVEYDKKESRLYYYGGDKNDANQNRLADYVTGFHVALYNTKASQNKVQEGQAWYQIDFSLNGKNYTTENTVAFRNKIGVNLPLDQVPVPSADLKTKVTDATITENTGSAIIMLPGSTFTFHAVVTGENFPSPEVTWAVNAATDYTINKNDQTSCTLTLSPNETSQQIEVVATSVDLPATSANATVATSYMNALTLYAGSVGENREVEATLSVTGKNLLLSNLDGIVKNNIFSFTDEKGDSVTDCNVKSITRTLPESSSAETVADNVKYKIIFDIDADAVPEQTRYASVNLQYPANQGSVGLSGLNVKSNSFITPAYINKIINARIVREDTLDRPGSAYSIWRGETAEFKAQLQYDGDDAWYDAPTDGSVTIEWNTDYGYSEDNIFFYNDDYYSGYTNENANVNLFNLAVSKDSSVLRYDLSESIKINLKLTDKSGSYSEAVYNANVPQVYASISKNSKSSLYVVKGKNMTVDLAVYGLILTNDNISLLHNQKNYPMNIKRSDDSNYYCNYQITFAPTSGTYVWFSLGTKGVTESDLSNNEYEHAYEYYDDYYLNSYNGWTNYINYSIKSGNVYLGKKANNGTAVLDIYIPGTDYSGNFYTSDGIKYHITTDWYNVYLTIDGYSNRWIKSYKDYFVVWVYEK